MKAKGQRLKVKGGKDLGEQTVRLVIKNENLVNCSQQGKGVWVKRDPEGWGQV